MDVARGESRRRLPREWWQVEQARQGLGECAGLMNVHSTFPGSFRLPRPSERTIRPLMTYGVPVSAVTRHRAVLSKQPIYDGLYALVHTLGRCRWLERSNLVMAAACGVMYLAGSPSSPPASMPSPRRTCSLTPPALRRRLLLCSETDLPSPGMCRLVVSSPGRSRPATCRWGCPCVYGQGDRVGTGAHWSGSLDEGPSSFPGRPLTQRQPSPRTGRTVVTVARTTTLSG